MKVEVTIENQNGDIIKISEENGVVTLKQGSHIVMIPLWNLINALRHLVGRETL